MKFFAKSSAIILASISIVFSSCSEKTRATDGRYTDINGAQWGCHDPKLFQDDDGRYYAYSTGWEDGVQIRYSDDLAKWHKVSKSPFQAENTVSDLYGSMYWDDDFLKWAGFATNDGKLFNTVAYKTIKKPQSWAPTVIKQNGKYYMFHGIVTDCLTYNKKARRAGLISLSVSDSPTGPFLPASKYDSDLYKQSTLVRCVWNNKNVESPEEIGYEGSYNSCNSNWNEGFGSIDPEFVFDIATGELFIAKIGARDCYAITYGSWLGGIALVYVDKESLKPVCTQSGKSTFDGKEYKRGDVLDCPLDSIENNQGVKVAGGFGAAYEGAQIIYNSETGYFYVFVSMGNLVYEYRVGVGRSKTIDGEYFDASGKSMLFKNASEAREYHAVGAKVLGAYQFGEKDGDEYGLRCPGGQSVLRDNKGRILLANHARTNFFPTGVFALQVHQMFFNSDGWCVVNMNDFSLDEKRLVKSSSKNKITGDYLINLTRRSAKNAKMKSTDNKTVDFNEADEIESLSKKITLGKDGKVSGAYTGNWTFEGGEICISLTDSEGKYLGEFKGVVLSAFDNTRKDGASADTITFTALNSTSDGEAKGEYCFANKI